MPDIRPSAQGIDYNMALGDVGEFIKEKRERGWSHLDILEAISALGRAGKEQINIMLEDLALRMEIRQAAEQHLRPDDDDGTLNLED